MIRQLTYLQAFMHRTGSAATVLFGCIGLALAGHAQAAETQLKPGATVSAFSLPNIGHDSSDMLDITAGTSDATVVCFLGTECPLAKLYAPRLAKLAKEFPRAQFVAVNSNRQDSTEDVAAYAASYKLPFPMLKDHRNVVADQFTAARTPEVFLLDKSFVIQYRGRIDDQYKPGISRKSPHRQELRDAIKELLAGKQVSTPHTQAVGCIIGRVKEPVVSSEITYCKHVAAILQRHCVECHQSGEIGPFQLTDYDEVAGWADTMLEVIDDGRMPPWHANPDHGEFLNARYMPAEDKETLRRWVEAGMPFGNTKDLPPTEPKPTAHGWRLSREPDQIVPMCDQAFDVPADGTVEYQYFVVDPGFKEDKWISGAQIVPGNPSIVHHSIAFIRPPDGSRFRGIGWLTAYVPGARIGQFPKSSAVFVPAGSKFVFQQHYTPNGTAQSDITKMGITFSDESDITHEIYTLVGIDQEFEIPPHASNHTITGRVNYLPHDAELLSVNPHMHLRGKSFRLFVEDDGQKSILLDVPNYDFNWQHTYALKNPIPMPEIDDLTFDVSFDNSSDNPVNPDPEEFVTWGDQTWEEMAVAFFAVREPRVKTAHQKKPVNAEQAGPSEEEVTRQKKKMAKEADRILAKFDKNKDGVVGRREAPFAFRRIFWQIDQNGDKQLTRLEIEEAARHRVN